MTIGFRRIGAALEHHTMFCRRHQRRVRGGRGAPDRVRILIWERGCGITRSSGTGFGVAAA
jgi:diaminopimelate epimerase